MDKTASTDEQIKQRAFELWATTWLARGLSSRGVGAQAGQPLPALFQRLRPHVLAIRLHEVVGDQNRLCCVWSEDPRPADGIGSGSSLEAAFL